MFRLHRDRRIAELLDGWSFARKHFIAVTSRRLFRSWDDLDRFFRSAYPHITSISSDAVHRDDGLPYISSSYILTLLRDMKASRPQLPAAAYLISAGGNADLHKTETLFSFPPHPDEVVRVQRWLKSAEGLPVEVLRVLLDGVSWEDEVAVQWCFDVYRQGVPAEYANALSLAPNAYFEAWSPELVAECYREGLPAEYLLAFWSRPDRFDSLRAAGVPYEYAVTLGEH